MDFAKAIADALTTFGIIPGRDHGLFAMDGMFCQGCRRRYLERRRLRLRVGARRPAICPHCKCDRGTWDGVRFDVDGRPVTMPPPDVQRERMAAIKREMAMRDLAFPLTMHRRVPIV